MVAAKVQGDGAHEWISDSSESANPDLSTLPRLDCYYIHAQNRFGHNTQRWCSWLSRQSNTLKVPGSNPGCCMGFILVGPQRFTYAAYQRQHPGKASKRHVQFTPPASSTRRSAHWYCVMLSGDTLKCCCRTAAPRCAQRIAFSACFVVCRAAAHSLVLVRWTLPRISHRACERPR